VVFSSRLGCILAAMAMAGQTSPGSLAAPGEGALTPRLGALISFWLIRPHRVFEN